jgi:hypothetical protein
VEEAFLNIGSAGIKTTITRLAGRPGVGVYRLELTMEWTPTRLDELEGAKIMVAGDLEVSFAQDARLPLGQLQALYAIGFPVRTQGTSTRVDLGVNLLPAQLEALERERVGGPLKLHLNLQGAVLRDATETVDASTQLFWGELVYRLKATDWIDVLEHWHYAQGFLLQVPKFTNRDSARAVRASDDLEQAIKDMTEGRYREAIAACRDTLETAYGNEDKDRYPELAYSVKGLSEADKQARFWLARRGVWAVAHAAKHRDETTREIEWERRDAQALILRSRLSSRVNSPWRSSACCGSYAAITSSVSSAVGGLGLGEADVVAVRSPRRS